jgi:phage baseplate assembly protein gpV
VAQVAAENLLIPIVDPSPWFHTDLTQTGTDFAFIKELASNNFFDAYVYWDKLYFQLPIRTQAFVLEWGQTLRSFSPRLSTAAMSGLQVIRGYNEELATAIVGVATGSLLDLEDIINRFGPTTLDMLAGLGRQWIHSQKISSPIDALALAKSLLQQLLDGLYQGSGSCIGVPALRAGSYIQIAGVGSRFSGTYRLRKVRHTFDDNGYLTEFDITQQAESALLSFIRKKTDAEVTQPPDRDKKFYGVYVATVLQAPMISSDPDPASLLGARVKVSFPWLSDLNESGWARVVSPWAGKDTGMYFMPNPGDTVIVAFQDGDISMPIVIGSVWDGPARPAVYPPSPLNSVQKIVTRAGHVITLDDTAGNLNVTLAHANGSTVAMTQEGNIAVKSLVGGINVTAQTGSINLNAPAGKINLQAQNITLQAQNVDVAVSQSMNVS